MDIDLTKRKGARKVMDVPEDVLALLDRGELETVNLTEWLAIDHIALIRHCFPPMDIPNVVIENLETAIKKGEKADCDEFDQADRRYAL